MKKTFVAILLFITAFNAYAQNNPYPANPFPKTISVNGSAEMEIIPDEIYVQVDLREYKKKNEEKKELEKIKAAFLNNCNLTGIADSNISIASYDGYNTSNIWQRKKVNPDMMAAISYQIKFTNAKQIDQLVEKLDDEGTSNFTIVRTSHSKIVEYRRQLKIQAVKAAKEKAIYLAEAINEKAGEAITVEEPQEYAVSDYGENRTLLSQVSNLSNGTDKYSDSSVDYRKIKLRYEVKALFALK
jgi:hypothetical protein